MPALMKLLSSYDLDLLTRIARQWEVETGSMNRQSIERYLFQQMTCQETVKETLSLLPQGASKAWNTLLTSARRIPWSEFIQRNGNLRELGPAAREREAPDLNPVNTTEILYYRGLIGRGFMDAAPEPREYAFIPEEIASLFPAVSSPSSKKDIRPVPPGEIKRHQAANLRLLDHMTDWLSSQRMGISLEAPYFAKAEISSIFIHALAKTCGLALPNGSPSPERIGQFLQADRLTTIKEWCSTWKTSNEINDLLMVPDLEFEGAWRNDPVHSRQVILNQISSFDVRTWYSLSSFTAYVKREMPDFLRSAGDFDSWSIRKTGGKEFLTGRGHWDEVEGAFLAYLFTGPLHWMGIVDLAYASVEANPIAFRLSPLAGYLLDENSNPPLLAAEVSPKLLADLTVVMPVNANRLLRYQVGRFTRIISNSTLETRFQVTAESLTNAEQNGLKVEQFLQLLEKYSKTPLPSSFKKLAERWDQRHVEVKMERVTLLRLDDPSILNLLLENPRTARLIREKLTETSIIIETAGMELIKKTLLEAGVLSQIELDV